MADYVCAGNTTQFADAAWAAELQAWTRFNAADAIRTGDGLYGSVMGNPDVPAWIGKLYMSWFFSSKAQLVTRRTRHDAVTRCEIGCRFHREGMFCALPDVTIELIDGPYMAATGSGIARIAGIRGTMVGPLEPPGFGPTGRRMVFETAAFSQLKHGLLHHHRVILSMLDLAREVGAVPRAGGIGERIGMSISRASARWLRWQRLQCPWGATVRLQHK